MGKDFTPQEWLAPALALAGLDQKDPSKGGAFKMLAANPGMIRVLHKETGAVWVFQCHVEREGVR